MISKRGTFKTEDSNGKVYEVLYTQRAEPAGTHGDPNAEVLGPPELWLGGNRVNRLDKGKYQIVGTNTLLTSKDPNAI